MAHPVTGTQPTEQPWESALASGANGILILGAEHIGARPGGANRYLVDLLSSLKQRGVPARALVAGPTRREDDDIRGAGNYGWPLLPRLIAISSALSEELRSAALVDIHFALHGFLLLLKRRSRRPAFVVHFQGPWMQESKAAGDGSGGLSRLIKWAIERAVHRRASEFVVLSNAFKKLLVEQGVAQPWHVTVVPPGVDLVKFAPGDQLASRLRLRLPPNAHISLAVRRLVDRMGLSLLLKAWAAVKDSEQDRMLLIVGDGPARVDLQRLSHKLGIDTRTQFLGTVSDLDLVHYYRSADVTLVPSLQLEGFGLAVLESLACGTPAISSNAGGLAEALVPLQPDLVVQAGDQAALSARMQSALSGVKPLPSPASCREYAEGFDWDGVAEKNLSIYRKAANPPREHSLRVVYLDHSAKLSGGEIALARLIPALGSVEAHVILGEDGPFVQELTAAGISVEVMTIGGHAGTLSREKVNLNRPPVPAAFHIAIYVGRLSRRIRQLAPDLVHTNSLKSGVYGTLAAGLGSTPLVWHLHDVINGGGYPNFAVKLIRRLASLSAGIIANSECTLAALETKKDLTEVIPAPIASTALSGLQNRDRPSVQAATKFLMVGRIAPTKGQHVFLDAFAKAFPEGREEAILAGAALFGEQDYEEHVKALANDLRLFDRVEFAGHTREIADILARGDVLVSASLVPEGFGLAIAEGMAAGLPVVVPNAGGPAEMVTDEVDGLLYPPGDVKALAAALKRLSEDPGLRQSLGERARARSKDLTPDVIAEQVMSFYRRVLGSRKL